MAECVKSSWLRWLIALGVGLGLTGCSRPGSDDDNVYRPDRSSAIRQQYVDREQAVEQSMEGRLAYQVKPRLPELEQLFASLPPEHQNMQGQMMTKLFERADQQPLHAALMLGALPENLEVDQAAINAARASLAQTLVQVRERLDNLPENAPVTVELVEDLCLLTILALTLDAEQYALDYERGVGGLIDALETMGRFGDLRGGLNRAFAVNEALCQAAYETALHGDDRLRSQPYFAFAPYWFMHRFQPNGMPYLTHEEAAGGNPEAIRTQTFSALAQLASLYPSPEIQWWFESFGDQAGPAMAMAQQYLKDNAELPEDFAPAPYGLYPHAGVLFWRSSWAPNADALYARGAVDNDPDSRLDAGQVSWTAHGDPVLIQAQADYQNTPALPEGAPAGGEVEQWTIPAHNVLRVGENLPNPGRAPIITRELSAAGGNLRIDASALYPELSQWHRDLFWEADGELRIIDNIRFDFGHRDRTTIFWHLSAEDPVKLTQDRSRTIVEWGDSAIVIQGNSPLEIEQFLVPDGPNSKKWHVALALRTIGRPPSLRVLTRVLPREADQAVASDEGK